MSRLRSVLARIRSVGDGAVRETTDAPPGLDEAAAAAFAQAFASTCLSFEPAAAHSWAQNLATYLGPEAAALGRPVWLGPARQDVAAVIVDAVYPTGPCTATAQLRLLVVEHSAAPNAPSIAERNGSAAVAGPTEAEVSHGVLTSVGGRMIQVSVPVRQREVGFVIDAERLDIPWIGVTPPNSNTTRPVESTPRTRMVAASVAVLAIAPGIVLAAVALLRPPADSAHHATTAALAAGPTPASPQLSASAGSTAEVATSSPAVSIAVPTVHGEPIPVAPTPGHLELAPNGRFGYIAHREHQPVPGQWMLSVLDTTINRITGTIPITSGPPRFVSFSPDSTRAYVSIYTGDHAVNLVAVLDTTTGALLAEIPVGRRPFATATSPDGSRLYVPIHDDARIDVIDTATHRVVAEIPVAKDPHWVAFSRAGNLLIANHDSNVVTELDLATNTEERVGVGISPHSIAGAPGADQAAVVNYDSSTVSIINTSTNAVVTVGVGANPQDIAYTPDGRYLLTANVDADTVSVVSASSTGGTANVAIPTGDGPTSVVVHPRGRVAYITNLYSATLTVLDTAY